MTTPKKQKETKNLQKEKASRKLLKDKGAKARQKNSQKQNKGKDSLIITLCIFVTAGVQHLLVDTQQPQQNQRDQHESFPN